MSNQREKTSSVRPVSSNDRFDAVANASVDGLLVIDSDGVVRFSNPAAVAMFAEQVENLVGFHFGTPAVREPTELQLHTKGEIRYMEIRASEFSWNGREATLANLRDITKRKQAEEALRESEALLSRTQEIAHTGSWKLDLPANRLTWSDEVYRIFGCYPQEFAPTYEAFLDFVHPEDRAAVDEAYSRSVREGIDGYDIEHRIVHRNSGEVRHVHERCVHERDASGTIIQSIGMVQDITERKEQQQALAAANCSLEENNRNLLTARQAALNMMQDFVNAGERLERSNQLQRSVINVLNFHIIDLQPFLDEALNEAIRLTDSKIGYIYFYDEIRQQFILNSWSKDVMRECSVMNPQTCYELDKTGIWGEAVRQRKPILLNNFYAAHPKKKGLPTGHVSLDRFLTVPIFENQRIVAVIGVANKPSDYHEQDVLALQLFMDSVWKSTKDIKSQQALKESEENLRITLNSIGDAVISTDVDGRVVSMNPVAESLTGWTMDEAAGLQLDEVFRIINEQTRHTVESPVDNVLKTGQIVGLASHTLLIAKDSRETPIADSGAPIKNSTGQTTGVVLVFRDQSAERAASRVLEESEARLRRAQKMALVGDWMFNLKTGTVNASDSARKLYGLPARKLGIEDIQKIPLPEFRPLLDAALHDLLHNGKPYDIEFTIRRPSDQVLIEIHSVAEYDSETETVLGVIQDITERKLAEQELRENEYQYRNLSNAGLALIWTAGTDKLCNYFNDPWLTFTGRTLEQEMGNGWTEGVHPDDFDRCLETYVTAFDKREPFEMEYRLRNAHGEYRIILDLGTPNFDTKGEFVGYIGHCFDVTERKQAETYREMGREILQILIEPGDLKKSIPRILDVLKTRTGFDAVGLRLQEGEDFPYLTQDGFSEDFLKTENTLVERGKDGGVCQDKDGNVCLECTCGLVISGKTDPSNPLFTQGGSCWINDSFPLLDLPSGQDPRLHPRNNCIHQGYASVALIPVRTKDRIVGLIQLNDKRKGRFTLEMIEILEGMAAHIGSALMRKQAESELRRLSTAIEQSPETVMITDTEGTIQYVNPAFEAVTGYTCEEAIGQNPRILKSGQQDAEFYSAMWNTLLDGRVWVGRMINKRKDGSLYTEDASIAPVKDPNGTITNHVGVKRDITAELEREGMLRQAQKMESVGRLAGGVAHDFNNLIMGILGYAELCRDDIAPDHPAQEWLIEITREAERSANLTRQLLAFARRQTVAPQVLDLNDAVVHMLKMLRRLIGEYVDLSWQPGAGLGSVKIDPGQVDQILANLCVNARDAIRGSGKITIKTKNVFIDADHCAKHAEASPGAYVRLTVSDTGCGMDQETLGNIFEPFFTTKGFGEGTGLGLATVYGIVKQNGGFVNVHSEPGRGSTFRIYIPRHLAKAVPEPGKEPERPSVHGHETVLLVEDEASILKMTAKGLQREGYTVLAAGTPDDAIRLATEHRGEVHLIISDVVMPEMNGRDLAKHILALYPTAKVLFMSGYTANVIAHNGVLDEDVNFIQKPFSKSDLLAKVRKALAQE